MEENTYALVLTGDVLPGHAEAGVWPALATYFRMEPEKLRVQLVARAPLTIKQSDDLGKLQTLQAGIAAVGAEAEVCAPDDRASLFVVLENTPRGPMPRVFVDERIERGLWSGRVSVAEVGSSTWLPFAELSKPAEAEAPVTPAPAFESNAFATRDTARSYKPTSAADHGHNLAAVAKPTAAVPQRLPGGLAIHAGFWRRCAAMLIDGLLLGVVMAVVQLVVSAGAIGTLASMNDGSAGLMALAGSFMLLMLIAFVGQWLYFALFEAGSRQATPGKLALGIKVVDEVGARIGFGRASGRYFGKIISGMVLYIGFVMAGFGDRKQALHDMIANTFVVFNDVQPGQPMPQTRPPMPWYGWLLNGLLVLGTLAMVAGWFWLIASFQMPH
jgi:uncharacterized RDD family membrane protein YckC